MLRLTAAQLIARLNAHELSSSRAFSAVPEQSKRPTIEASDAPAPVRHFNTSRAHKAVNDGSTIDFAYLPSLATETEDDYGQVRVPIIPTNFNPDRTGVHAPEQEEVSAPHQSLSSAQPLPSLTSGPRS